MCKGVKISILFLKNDDIFCIISEKTGFSKNILIINNYLNISGYYLYCATIIYNNVSMFI